MNPSDEEPPDDPTRHYHGGNRDSEAAWEKARPGYDADCETSFQFIKGCEPDGATDAEIDAARFSNRHPGRRTSTASARGTSLAEAKRIVTYPGKAERRNGSRVNHIRGYDPLADSISDAVTRDGLRALWEPGWSQRYIDMAQARKAELKIWPPPKRLRRGAPRHQQPYGDD